MTFDRMEHRRRGGAVFGLLLAAAGVLYMLKQFNLIHFHFHIWPFFLIFVAIMTGFKHRFRHPVTYILLLVGIAYLIPAFTIFNQPSTALVWPVVLIIGGLLIAFKPKKHYQQWHDRQMGQMGQEPGGDFDPANDRFAHRFARRERFRQRFDPCPPQRTHRKDGYLNIDAVFGGRKEVITSKNFTGAYASAICAGLEINLMQADSEVQPMVMTLGVICGGVEIILPSHWEIVNELDVLLGGIEDRRTIRTGTEAGSAKTLILRGSVTLGGVELKSY